MYSYTISKCNPSKDKNLNCSQATYEDLKCTYLKYQELKCAHPEHQKPIQIVVLDPNLKQNERLLCKSCIKEFESNQKTIGLEKAVALTYENYQKKRELREIVINENIKQLEQLNKNFISLKTFVNQKIDEMIQTTQNWMKDLNQVKSQQYQFYDQIDLLIKQQKIEIDLIAEEIKALNNSWISKLKINLEWFSKFNEYSDCVNTLNNLSQDQVQKQQQKNDRVNVKKPRDFMSSQDELVQFNQPRRHYPRAYAFKQQPPSQFKNSIQSNNQQCNLQ